MRRFLLAIGAIAIGVTAVLATAVSSAATQPSVIPATVSFSISGSVAGRVKSAQLTNQVTFVFTEKNTGNVSASEFLVLKSLTNASVENLSCVETNGLLFNPDGSQCEFVGVALGRSSSFVLSVTITGTPSVSAKVCLSNGTTCKTLSIAVV
jgi:hypothetical protein